MLVWDMFKKIARTQVVDSIFQSSTKDVQWTPYIYVRYNSEEITPSNHWLKTDWIDCHFNFVVSTKLKKNFRKQPENETPVVEHGRCQAEDFLLFIL